MLISPEVKEAETTTSSSIPALRQLEHAMALEVAHHELVAAMIPNQQEREGFKSFYRADLLRAKAALWRVQGRIADLLAR